MTTHKTLHLTADEFTATLVTTRPGDAFIYATGSIAWALYEAAKNNENVGHLTNLQRTAYDAYETGKAHLTQKKLAPFKCEYRATRVVRG